MKSKPRVRKIKKMDRKRKPFMDDEIEDWMIGQPLENQKE
jgi:hypothetical protein